MLVACIDVIGPLSTDAYIPNLPEMQRELDAPAWLGGLTLQANWLAKGVATLAIGALADDRRVGRRGALLGAFIFYVAGGAGPKLRGAFKIHCAQRGAGRHFEVHLTRVVGYWQISRLT